MHELGEYELRFVYGIHNFTGLNTLEFADKVFELWPGGEWVYLHRSQTGAEPATMSGSISVAFSAKWDVFHNYSYILDCGQDWDDNNVAVGNHLETNSLSFHSYHDRQNYWLNVGHGIPKHMPVRYL